MLSIIQGNIFQHQAQTIALPSDMSLKNSPGLRQLAYDYFGYDNIQQPCNIYLSKNKPSSIQYSQVITLPINVKGFKSIIHCIVPIYDEKQSDQSYVLLNQLFENLFNEIYQNKIKSVLIPTLGCGSANYALDESLLCFANSFQNFQAKLRDVNIKLVVYDKQEYEFVRDLLQFITQDNSHVYKNVQSDYSQQQNQHSIASQQKQQKKMIFEEFNDDDNTLNSLKYQHNQKYDYNNKNDKMEIEEKCQNDQFQQYQQDQQQSNLLPLKNYKQNQYNQKKFQQNIPTQQNFSTDIKENNQVNKIMQSIENPLPLLKQSSPNSKNKILISLYIDINEKILELIKDKMSLITFMLEVCQDVYKLHQQLLKNEKKPKQKNNVFNYSVYYKLSENLKELQPFCPPEMREHFYVSELHDSFAIGILFKSVIDMILKNENDQQLSKMKLFIEKQISESTNERAQINQIFNNLQSLFQNKQLIEQHHKTSQEMEYFYQKQKIIMIQEFKKQMLEIAQKNCQDQKFMQNSFGDDVEKIEDQFQKLQINQKDSNLSINEQKQNFYSNIQQQQDDQFQELNLNSKFTVQNQSQQNRSQQDYDYKKIESKLTNIDCMAIPVHKYKFKQSLPSFLKLGFVDNVLEDIVNLAQSNKEHFLQSVRTTIPTLNCNYFLLVFCPNEDTRYGRQIQLANCFLDILLYSLKCLKLPSCCLSLEDIYNQLIVDKTGLPIDTPSKAFQEALQKYPDQLQVNQLSFQDRNYTVVQKEPLRFSLSQISVLIYQQDITQIKGVDAIVNAVNNQLVRGGGVCGSIFVAAGENKLQYEIKQKLYQLGRNQIDTSEVLVTKSYNLEQGQGPKYIFHAVGPIYNQQEPQKSITQLSKCIINILKNCLNYQISSIAIPIISAGIYGFPIFKCAEIIHSTILNFEFKTSLTIHIVDIVNQKIEILQSIFKDVKQREIIYSQLENTPPTDCLVGPIDLQNPNTGVVSKIIELAGPSFKNELEYKINNYQMIDNDIQHFLIQAYEMKFNNIYNVLLISPPKNQRVKSFVLYQVFFQILVETFLKKKFSSITILIYSILQQCIANEEDLKIYNGTKTIQIFLQVIQDFQQIYNQECGKITILSNVAQFWKECEFIFK